MSNTFYVCPASSHSKSAEVEAPPSPISHIYICLSTHPLICPPAHQPTHHTYIYSFGCLLFYLIFLSIHSPFTHSLCTSIYPSFLYLPLIHIHIHLCTHLCICLSIHPPIRHSDIPTPTHLPVCSCIHPSIHPLIYTCPHQHIHLPIHPSICVFAIHPTAHLSTTHPPIHPSINS